MDHITAHGRSLPPPFNTRDLHLQPYQFHSLQHQSAEDEQSGSSSGLNLSQKREHDDNSNNDGGKDVAAASGEAKTSRRPRGRPVESKNKPKPSIIINRDSANALRTHVMEVADGCDIVDSVSNFALWCQRGVCIMNGTGTMTNVTLRQPASSGAVVTLHGRFEILSLSGSFLPSPALPAASGLTIYLSGGQGQVVGGTVVSTLIAARPVVIMAASFSNAAYERLPLEEEDPSSMALQGGTMGSPTGLGQQQQQQLMGDLTAPLFHGLPPNLANSIQLPSDQAFWATGRPPY